MTSYALDDDLPFSFGGENGAQQGSTTVSSTPRAGRSEDDSTPNNKSRVVSTSRKKKNDTSDSRSEDNPAKDGVALRHVFGTNSNERKNIVSSSSLEEPRPLKIIRLFDDHLSRKDGFINELRANASVKVFTLADALPEGVDADLLKGKDIELRCEHIHDNVEGTHADKPFLFDTIRKEAPPFSFTVTSVNRPMSHLCSVMLACIAENKNGIRKAFCRVGKNEERAYARSIGSFLRYSNGTIFERINTELKPLCVSLFRVHAYGKTGRTTKHKDFGDERDDYFISHLGVGFFCMHRQTGGLSQRGFLDLECSNHSVGFVPEDAFMQTGNNPYFHQGGGGITLMFRTIDGTKITQRMRNGIMSFLCHLDCQLEQRPGHLDRRSDQQLLNAINIPTLDWWDSKSAKQDGAHFQVMVNYIKEQGPTFLQQPFRVMKDTWVYSPTKGRKFSVYHFIENIDCRIRLHGPSFFTEEQWIQLAEIGIAETTRRRADRIYYNSLPHYYLLKRYKEEGGDINKLETCDTLVEGDDGRLVIELRKNKGAGSGLMNTGEWLKQQIKNRESMRINLFEVVDKLGVNWARVYDNRWTLKDATKLIARKCFINDPMYALLREFKEQGGYINDIGKGFGLVRGADGQLHKRRVGQGKDDVGRWIENQRIYYKNGNRNADRIKALEELGLEWRGTFGQYKNKNAEPAR